MALSLLGASGMVTHRYWTCETFSHFFSLGFAADELQSPRCSTQPGNRWHLASWCPGSCYVDNWFGWQFHINIVVSRFHLHLEWELGNHQRSLRHDIDKEQQCSNSFC